MQRPSLSFIHGFMGCPADWDDFQSQLFSRVPHDSISIQVQPSFDWETGIQKLADQLPARSFLVGYSMGARLALAVAMEFPEKVDGVIFISGNPGIESPQARNDRWQADVELANRIEHLRGVEARRSFLLKWYQQEVFASVPQQVIAGEIERKLERDPWEWSAVLRTFSVGQQPDYWHQLESFSIPLCVVVGESDDKYKRMALRLEAMNKAMNKKNWNVAIVANCGHLVHREKPESLVELIQDCLQAWR